MEKNTGENTEENTEGKKYDELGCFVGVGRKCDETAETKKEVPLPLLDIKEDIMNNIRAIVKKMTGMFALPELLEKILNDLLYPPSKYTLDDKDITTFSEYSVLINDKEVSVTTKTGIIHLIDDLEHVLGKWGTICPINEGIISYLKHLRKIWMPIYKFAEDEATRKVPFTETSQLPNFNLKEGFKAFWDISDRWPREVLKTGHIFSDNPRFSECVWRWPSWELHPPSRVRFLRTSRYPRLYSFPYITMGLLKMSDIKQKSIGQAARGITIQSPTSTDTTRKVRFPEGAISPLLAMVANPFDSGIGKCQSKTAISKFQAIREYRISRNAGRRDTHGEQFVDARFFLLDLAYIPELPIVVVDFQYFNDRMGRKIRLNREPMSGCRNALGPSFTNETVQEIENGCPELCTAYLIPKYEISARPRSVLHLPRFVRTELTEHEQEFENMLVDVMFKNADMNNVLKRERLTRQMVEVERNIIEEDIEAYKAEEKSTGSSDPFVFSLADTKRRVREQVASMFPYADLQQYDKEIALTSWNFEWYIENIRHLRIDDTGLWDQWPLPKIYHSQCLLTGCSAQIGRKAGVLKRLKRTLKRRGSDLRPGFCTRTCDREEKEKKEKQNNWFNSKIENMQSLPHEFSFEKLKEGIVLCVKEKCQLFLPALPHHSSSVIEDFFHQLEHSIIEGASQHSSPSSEPTVQRTSDTDALMQDSREDDEMRSKTKSSDFEKKTPQKVEGGKKRRTKKRRKKKRMTKKRRGKKRRTKKRRVRKRRTKKH
jgi:hypothetical protein